ncbi:MAG: hypothetical protein ACRDDX_03960 [Cellulosilyticaceae bacterium]
MKTNTTLSMDLISSNRQLYKKVNKMAQAITVPIFKELDSSLRRCFFILKLKGNRRSLTFLLPFYFIKKEGVLC